MKLVFCISNLFIPLVLTIIKNNKEKGIVIYTDQIGVYNFFKKINFSNIILYYREPCALSRDPRQILRYLHLRTKILNDLKEFDFLEIIFFHKAFGNLENWLLTQFPKKIKKTYCPVTEKLPFQKRYYWKSEIIRLMNQYLHNTEVIPLWTGERFIFALSDKFLKKIKAEVIHLQINEKYISNLTAMAFDLDMDVEFILLTGTVVEFKQVTLKEYESKIDSVIKHLTVDKIASKPHPREPSRYSLERQLSEIPSYIPANVLFSKYKSFIGYSSTVLTEAANHDLLAISLLEYMTPISPERKEKYKDYLQLNLKEGKTILFPKNAEEFQFIINTNK